MADSVALVGAVAASLAAAISAATFVVVGKREERRWRREAMIEGLVQFLGCSFAGIGNAAREARQRGDDLAVHRRDDERLHDSQISVMTRLRLLAPGDVVLAAEELHEADHAVAGAVLDAPAPPTDEEWKRIRERQQAARTAVSNAGRRAFGLGRAAELRHVYAIPHRHHPS